MPNRVKQNGTPPARKPQEFLMRFMSIVTSSQPMQGPTPALMEAMGKLIDKFTREGALVDTPRPVGALDRNEVRAHGEDRRAA